MIENGLENEARGLYPLRHLNALQTVGYKEFFDYFEQKADIGQTIEKICQHTRNYAKRQITWFRRDPELHWMAPDRNSIMNFLKNQIYAA
jgi:tRNA dimethylallyltransferase